METITILILIFGLMFFEIAVFDPFMWETKLKSREKAISNLVFVAGLAAIGWYDQIYIENNWALSAIFLGMSIRFSLFDYLFNAYHGNKIKYLGDSKTERFKKKMPFAFRLWLEIFVLLCGVMQYLYFNCTIYCNDYTTIIFNLPRFIKP